MKSVGGLGTVAIVLALAAPASGATTYTVDPNKSAPGCDGTTCKSIDEAAGPATNGDTIRLLPGFYTAPANPFTEQFTLTGSGAGAAVIFGTVTFEADGMLKRVAVSGQGNSPAVQVTAPTVGSRTVTIESSILTGSGSGAGISATATALGSVAVEARHVTVADSASAPALTLTDPVGTGTPTASFTNSIVHGAGPVTGTNNDTNTSPGVLFVDPGHENFLLGVGSPAIDQGGGPAGGETTDDVEGEPRTGTWDRGADEFVNHPPGSPTLIVAPNPAAPGESVSFGAFTSDPDASRGDLPTTYRWNFGDGSPVVNALASSSVSGVTTHTYAAPGQYVATVTALDRENLPSAASNPVTVVVSASAGGGTGGGAGGGGSGPDIAPPKLSITSPRAAQRLKRGKRAPVLRGRTSDATGVRSVELALRRFDGRRCRWYDGRRSFALGSCATPRFFRALINDFTWTYTFPRGIVPRSGRYELRARATDFLGHRTTAFSASARTLVGFRIVL